MALPLPRVVPDTGPGGMLADSMGAINALNNAMIQRDINKIKADYMPLTTQAEAASKLAYANLMGPQFLAKLLQNPGAVANMGDRSAKEALGRAVEAGMGGGSGNALNFGSLNNPGKKQTLAGNFSNALQDLFMSLMGKNTQNNPNPLANDIPFTQQQNSNENPFSFNKKGNGAVTYEAEQGYDQNGNPVYEEEETIPEKPMDLELTKIIPEEPFSKKYAEKTGKYQGTIAQREAEGKYRADALNSIGQSQLALSNSGAVLDRMTDIVNNPVFREMRNNLPFYQDKQLDWIQKTGTPEQQELIGDFLSTGESFIASTVQGFGGRPLVREFDLAKRQKITPSDTVDTALGKLRSARSLHDIAEKKNEIVSDLLQQGYNESDAIKKANKMVDVKQIEKETNERLQRKIEIINKKTGDKRTVTIEEARKLGIPNV